MQSRSGHLTFSPSDLTAYLACRHLTQLERRAALGGLQKPELDNPQTELVFRKGEEHERAYFDGLRAAGKTVTEIELGEALDWERAACKTADAIRSGVDVVFQGVFLDHDWRGIADFLERQPDGYYEVVDTKLARHAKPAHILQLCFYTEQLGRIQGQVPELMHVLLGSGERDSLRLDDFSAYYRRLRGRFVDFASFARETEPYPVEHCDRCDFIELCGKHWNSVDHLSRVARLSRRQFERLDAAGITTLAGLGTTDTEFAVEGISPETLTRLRNQAALQLRARETRKETYRLLRPAADTGFALLPEPSPGDLFFDMEGDPFWDPKGGLEYLFGVLWQENGGTRFQPFWAHDRPSERRAFEDFIDLVHERLALDPGLHVYHYANYEITTLRRLMGQFGTRERELDDLLRRGVFVDLYAVVRNALQSSQPRYGLKNLEVFLPIERQADVKEGGDSILMFEEWTRTGNQAILDDIGAYNEEDCRATFLLRNWLLERKQEAIVKFGPIPPPRPEPPVEESEAAAARAELRLALLETGDSDLALAGELLEYHRREAKPVWWAYFERLEQSPDDLVEDPDSIGRLEVAGEPVPVARSLAWTLVFPAQEHKIAPGQETVDPATGKGPGELLEIDSEAHRLVLKRGKSFEDVELPRALIPGGPFRTGLQQAALMRLGNSLLAGDGQYPALESILRRTPFDRSVQTNDLDELEQLLLGLDGGHLFIQGPPGSGKTWMGGRLAARLLRRGKRVGFAATSHKAIHNLLAAVEEAGLDVRACKKASAGNPESFYGRDAVDDLTSAEDCLDYPLAAGTAWLFSRDDFDQTLDYLFVDEAGQVSLADALALGTSARNVVLLGDPNQLPQVIQGSHPERSAASVLEHLLGEETTIPEDRGVFLERTFRMHPDLCGYISEVFYEGRLEPDPCTRERTTPFGAGLRYVAVEHEGRRQDSPEEAERVREEVERLLAAGVDAGQIVVVAAYNAQVNLVRDLVPEAVRVGTVDKFQGQQADVVLYTMASSSGEDIPRSLEFLFSRNRLNVAISRARCLAYLIANPRLLEVDAKTIEHMRLANALCRFVEIADVA